MACSRNRIMQGSNPEGLEKSGSSYVFCVPVVHNSVGLENIICNSGVQVPLQLLAIEETIIPTHSHACIYDGSVKTKDCFIDHKLFAHLHVTSNDPNAFIKHYIIVFVEGKKSERIDELVEILYHTVKRLKIESERPHFYIYYHGNRPAVNMSLSEARNKITKKLRPLLKNFKDKEPFCKTSDTLRERKDLRVNVKNFIIHQSDKNSPYEFNFS